MPISAQCIIESKWHFSRQLKWRIIEFTFNLPPNMTVHEVSANLLLLLPLPHQSLLEIQNRSNLLITAFLWQCLQPKQVSAAKDQTFASQGFNLKPLLRSVADSF